MRRKRSANLKQTEKAGKFALADFMRIMLKNAVAAPREQRLKNEVCGNVVKCANRDSQLRFDSHSHRGVD